MKKKIFVALAIFFAVSFFSNQAKASIKFYSSCGIAATTVIPDDIQTWAEFEAWIYEFDDILCGGE